LFGWLATPDGSWLSHLRKSNRRSSRMTDTDVAVWVVDFGLDDPGRPQTEERHRLIIAFTDPDAAPARELTALYPQR
jgi:hypothetical protein